MIGETFTYLRVTTKCENITLSSGWRCEMTVTATAGNLAPSSWCGRWFDAQRFLLCFVFVKSGWAGANGWL